MTGGGELTSSIYSWWKGYLRFARNRISATGDVRDTKIGVFRKQRGAGAGYSVNQIYDDALRALIQYSERYLEFSQESLDARPEVLYDDPYLRPKIFSESTYRLDPVTRSHTAAALMRTAESAGMLAAGYIEIGATGYTVVKTNGLWRYYPFTTSQYSVTVRDPDGTGSGWAGVDWYDWGKIDAERLTAIALDKCLRSRNPVALEPGRYTTILEPQAVADLFSVILDPSWFARQSSEGIPDQYAGRFMAERGLGPFASRIHEGFAKINEQILDTRLTVSTSPDDEELGYLPFNPTGDSMRRVTWIEQGVLKALPYGRDYAISTLQEEVPLPWTWSYKISGGPTSVDEMIETTKRGLLVTRFDRIGMIDIPSLLCSGYTRDGIWLIENGKISKAVKNFRFTESPLFAFNNVEQIGQPQRVFRPGYPTVVPPMKVRDFSFTSLSDAV
jgi:predicted Zn-dependent protease